MELLILKFNEISIDDVPMVRGKNASLGEMVNRLAAQKIAVPAGFATTAEAFWLFIDKNLLRDKLKDLLGFLDTTTFSNLDYIGRQARSLILNAGMPNELKKAIFEGYKNLCGESYFEVAI